MTIIYELAEPLKFSIRDQMDLLALIKKSFTYSGFVYTCSPLTIPIIGPPTCSDQEALSGADVEAYVRLSKNNNLIAEDIEIDLTGKFEFTEIWYNLFFVIPIPTPSPTQVEVYQKTPDGDHILYTGDHYFKKDQSEYIFIDRDKVEIIPIPEEPTAASGNYFGFERIGNIPVECIFKEGDPDLPSNEFIGYVDSSGDRPNITLGDADLKLKDYAFGSYLHLYGNIGEDFGQELLGGVDMSQISVKYFRLKYSYFNPETEETINDTYISNPFNNTRKTTLGTATEFMGPFNNHPVTGAPLAQPTYIYANPYETDSNKDWKYRGLLFVLNTKTLPRNYGRYTITIEPLDENMNPVNVADNDDCVIVLLVDNDHAALTADIEDILVDNTSIGPCEIFDLTGKTMGETSEIKVIHTVNDAHGNLRNFGIIAYFGKNGDVPFGEEWYSRSGTTPYWNGVESAEKKEEQAWVQCAYQFRLYARRRVTNGFYTLCYKEFTYHITIMSNNSYLTIIP